MYTKKPSYIIKYRCPITSLKLNLEKVHCASKMYISRTGKNKVRVVNPKVKTLQHVQVDPVLKVMNLFIAVWIFTKNLTSTCFIA